jgi:hypothetical protein
MLRFIIYAILIYIVYLAVKWAYRLGSITQKNKNEVKSAPGNKPKPKIDPRDVEDAEFTEIKKQ